MNFFSAVQGKFDAKYHGRYLGNILEQIADIRREVIEPILKAAPLGGIDGGRWTLSKVKAVTAEFSYLQEHTRQTDRRADLAIELDSGRQTGTILVEIKMNDAFQNGQLQAYIDWAKKRDRAQEDRAVVVLTAYPIKREERELIRKNEQFIQHIYLSNFMERLLPKIDESELIRLLSNYLTEEGYAMYQLPRASVEGNGDYEALLSFMALAFLPPESGKGKVASAKKIARGPSVFGHIIQNWQLISYRFADLYLNVGRRPTIRYFPEQKSNSKKEYSGKISPTAILDERRNVRLSKDGGRFWLTADVAVKDGIRAEWGQVIQVTLGKSEDAAEVKCTLYALIREGAYQLGGKVIHLPNGIESRDLYTPEKFLEKLYELMGRAETEARKADPELCSILKRDSTTV